MSSGNQSAGALRDESPKKIVRRHIHSTSQLFRAIPLTIESFVIGIISHRYWYPKCRTFREATLFEKKEGGEEMVYKLPEDIMFQIEDDIKADGHALGVAAWNTYDDSLAQAYTNRENIKIMQDMRDTLNDPGASGEQLIHSPTRLSGKLRRVYGRNFRPSYNSNPALLDVIRTGLCPIHEREELYSPQHIPNSGHQYQKHYRRQAKNAAAGIKTDILMMQWGKSTDQTVTIVDPEYL
ncbi:hypothetical protein B0J14DRAFT_695837 [Halenospora varia]|nr:hypothetical protein B0J14DRAFT_695837 [Halenospora varia]